MRITEMTPSKYLKKEDAPSPVLVTVSHFSQENVAPEDKPSENKWVMYFEEFGERGLVMNVTNLHLAAEILGSDETDDWVGKKIVLYTDPNVSYSGKRVGGLRFRAVKNQAAAQGLAPIQQPHREPSVMSPRREEPSVSLQDMDDDIPF